MATCSAAALAATGALAAGRGAHGAVTKPVQTGPPMQGLSHFDTAQRAADRPAAAPGA
jgi:hypothetical protein